MMSARVTDSPTKNVCSRRYPSSTFSAFCTEAIAASSFCTLQLISSTDCRSSHHNVLTSVPFANHQHFFIVLCIDTLQTRTFWSCGKWLGYTRGYSQEHNGASISVVEKSIHCSTCACKFAAKL